MKITAIKLEFLSGGDGQVKILAILEGHINGISVEIPINHKVVTELLDKVQDQDMVLKTEIEGKNIVVYLKL